MLQSNIIPKVRLYQRCKNGKIYSLPRMLFDPRRKLNALPTDREEGIIPYEPQIKLAPGYAVNYYQEG